MPRSGAILGDLQSDRPLPRDHVGVVEWMDEVPSDLLDDARDDLVAVLCGPIIGDDARAAPLGPHALRRGASDGMTMVAGTPKIRAASATPCAWLPEDTATTPRCACPGSREERRCRRRGT